MRSGRSTPGRAIALSLACGVNALFLLLLLSSHERPDPEPVATALMWVIASVERSRPASQGSSFQTGGVGPQVPAPGTAVVSPAVADRAVPRPATGSLTEGAAPFVDWYTEAEKAAQELAQNGEQEAGSSDPPSYPEIQLRPESHWIPRMKGTEEKIDGGGTRIWTSDLCYLESNPLDFDPFRGGFRGGYRSVCKVRSLQERQSEARAEAIADAVRRKRGAAPAWKPPVPAVPIP